MPGSAVGTSVGAPAGDRVVTGTRRYTMDTAMEGMLHLKVLHSPHAHARIVSIDKTAALAVPGVHRVYTWEDVPRKRFTTAIHTDHLVDPDDTYILDNVMRFAGNGWWRCWPIPSAPPRRAAAGWWSNTRCCPPSSIPRRRWRTAHRSCTGRATPSFGIPNATFCWSCTARSATWPQVSRRRT